MQNQYGQGDQPDMSRLRSSARRAKKRAAQRRARALLFLIIAATAAVIFLTPVFNIRSVSVDGRVRVTDESIDAITAPIAGKNLFTINTGDIKRSFEMIPYVKDIHIKRKLYPPSVKITIEERQPAAYAATAGGFAVFDETCSVLEIVSQPPSDIKQIMGISLKNTEAGQLITAEDESKTSIVFQCIRAFAPLGDKVKSIDVSENDSIKFDYEGRLTVICGSTVALEDKIRLFSEVVNSNRTAMDTTSSDHIAENARGTVDLSTEGKATYIP